MVAELAQNRVAQLRHGALLYASLGEYVASVARFAETAAQAGPPVLVPCAKPGVALLRQRLNGHGGLVTWADMRDVGVNPARLIDTIRLFTGQHRGRVVWGVPETGWPARAAGER